MAEKYRLTQKTEDGLLQIHLATSSDVVSVGDSTLTDVIISQEEEIATKADEVTLIDITLLASGWSEGEEPPFTQTVSVTGVDSTTVGQIGMSDTANTLEWDAAGQALIRGVQVTTNSITFTAEGIKPLIDIPSTIMVFKGAAPESDSSTEDYTSTLITKTKISFEEGSEDWETNDSTYSISFETDKHGICVYKIEDTGTESLVLVSIRKTSNGITLETTEKFSGYIITI